MQELIANANNDLNIGDEILIKDIRKGPIPMVKRIIRKIDEEKIVTVNPINGFFREWDAKYCEIKVINRGML